MSEAPLKACRVCCEEIAEGAKRCPKCQQWQSTVLLALGNPLVRVVILLIIGSYFILFNNLLPQRALGLGFGTSESEPFVNSYNVSDLKVRNTILNYGEDARGPSISVVGMVKNEGDIRWVTLAFQVQYFNSSNTLIDATTDLQFETDLPPHGERAFKITRRAERPRGDYASAKVIVTSGRIMKD